MLARPPVAFLISFSCSPSVRHSTHGCIGSSCGSMPYRGVPQARHLCFLARQPVVGRCRPRQFAGLASDDVLTLEAAQGRRDNCQDCRGLVQEQLQRQESDVQRPSQNSAGVMLFEGLALARQSATRTSASSQASTNGPSLFGSWSGTTPTSCD